jgi:membrane protease YdiL (CAAX protease family)
MKNESSISNIILFFLIALGWSCGIWIFLTPTIQNNFGFHLDPVWAWLGLIGPGLSAILVSIKENGLAGINNLFKPLLKWRVPVIYYFFVYIGVMMFYFAASWLSLLTYGTEGVKSYSWLLENVKAPFFNLHGIWVVIEITLIYTFCEELGWRGYALPKMNNYLTGLLAAIIIGFFWTLWHVPLIYLYGSSLNLNSAIIYFLHIECMSIFYAWLYFKTDRSLLLAGLFHGTTDGIGAFFPITNSLIGQGPNLPTVILEIIIALLMVPYLLKVKPMRANKY